MVYRCELCNGRITKKGKGIKTGRKFELIPLDKADKHICIKCIQAIASIVSNAKDAKAEKAEKEEIVEKAEKEDNKE